MELAVVVVGGGAAGALAALAARRAGATVTVIARAQGATAVSSGAIGFGVANDHRGSPLPWSEAVHAIATAHPHHPYALLKDELVESVRGARDFVCSELASLNLIGPDDGSDGPGEVVDAVTGSGEGARSGGGVRAGDGVWGRAPELRLITPTGAVLRTTLAQGSIARGDLSRIPPGTRIGVVGVEGVGAFDPWLVVLGLRDAGFDAVPVSARVPMDPQSSLADLARLLDGDARDAFVAKTVAACNAVNARFAFVPTAGLRAPEAFCDALCASGLDGAAEIVGMLPSLPGLRLQRALDSRLDEVGVTRIHANVASVELADVDATPGPAVDTASRTGSGASPGIEVDASSGSDGERSGGSPGGFHEVGTGNRFPASHPATASRPRLVRSVRLDNGETIATDALVLATGRFVSGGIRHDGRFVEPLLGLPVYVDGDDPGERWIGDLLDRSPFGSQPALRAGVRVDSHMRPLDESGQCAARNLFAVGSVIGGYDLSQDSTGLGVAAVTAIRAAKHIGALAGNRK